jgi:hypothetical protein
MLNQENELIDEHKLKNLKQEKIQLMNTINSVTDEVNIINNNFF